MFENGSSWFEAARRSYLNMSKTLDGNDVPNEEF